VKDGIIVTLLSASVATMVTAHLALVYGLFWRSPRWRAPVALLLPPLAAAWGFQARMKVRSAALIGGAVVYAFAAFAALRA
jgi:hypothetical protein